MSSNNENSSLVSTIELSDTNNISGESDTTFDHLFSQGYMHPRLKDSLPDINKKNTHSEELLFVLCTLQQESIRLQAVTERLLRYIVIFITMSFLTFFILLLYLNA